MRILIVNDDGINAPGLSVAEEIAGEVGGPDAEIWVVAPAVEKSGASHCVSYTTPMRVIEMGTRRFAIEGYPADCAIAGICDLMPKRPDILLSGVNRGHNVAEDAVYSGTVAGAKEGSIQGIKSISLSQYFSARDGDLFDAARVHGAEAVRKALALPWKADTFYNINFPPCVASETKGFKLAPQGTRGGAFRVEAQVSPNNRKYLWLAHSGGNMGDAGPDADCALCAEGWVAMTPMRPDLTDHALLAEARAAFVATTR